MSEANDQPVAEDTSAPGVVAETPAATDDIDTEAFDRMPAPDDDADPDADDGDRDAEPEGKQADGDDEDIEVEVGGKKLRVPKAVEPLLLMQSDYTKKTQAIAEQARQLAETQSTLEAQRAQQAESIKAFRDEHLAIGQAETALAHLDTQLADYRKLSATDWATLKAQQPEQYAFHSDNYEFLRRTRASTEDTLDAARKDLSTKEAKLTDEQKRSQAANLQAAWGKTHETLGKVVKDWTPQRFQETAKFAMERYGYSKEDLESSPDPRPWRMAIELQDALSENAKLTASLKQQTTAQNNVKANTVTPAQQPRGNAQPRGVNDGLSDAEWMRRRDAQVAKKRA